MTCLFKSHLGVYGFILRENNILLVKKSRGPYLGLLDLPGGSIETSETIEEALVREVKEETGYLVTDYKQIITTCTKFKYQEDNKDCILKHIAILYKIEVEGELKTEICMADSAGANWYEITPNLNDVLTPMALFCLENLDLFKRR